MPQQHMVIPHYMRNSKEMVVERRMAEDSYVDIKRQDSDSSLSSFQDIPLLIPQEADGSGASNEGSKSNELEMGHNFDEQSSRDGKVPFSFRKLIDEPSVAATPMKGFLNDDYLALKQDLSLDVLHPGNRTEKEWSEAQEQDDQLVSADEPTQVGPRVSCCCQVNYTVRIPDFSLLLSIILGNSMLCYLRSMSYMDCSILAQAYFYRFELYGPVRRVCRLISDKWFFSLEVIVDFGGFMQIKCFYSNPNMCEDSVFFKNIKLF